MQKRGIISTEDTKPLTKSAARQVKQTKSAVEASKILDDEDFRKDLAAKATKSATK